MSQPTNVVPLSDRRANASVLLAAAKRAQQSWAELPVATRLSVVKAFRQRLAAAALDIVGSIDKRPRRDSLTGEVLPLLAACRYLERHAVRLLRSRRRRGHVGAWLSKARLDVSHEPFGTVLVIGPANYPLMLPGIQSLQALVAGNAVIIKPAPRTSAVLERFVAMLEHSGIPTGLVSLVDESVETADELVSGLVDRIVITGSGSSGRAVLRHASEHLTPVTAELSGWDPCIVLDDADVDRAVKAISFGVEFNAGETCVAPRRILVSTGLYATLTRKLAERLDSIGPIPFSVAAERMSRTLIENAVARGARVAAGRLGTERIVGPLLLVDVDATMPIFDIEVFAPIALVTPVRDIDDAIDKANATTYGLGASIFAATETANRIARRLDVGVVMINDAIVPAAHPALPLAPRHGSGLGVTRGPEGLLAMTRPKAVIRNDARRPRHFSRGGVADEFFAAYLRLAHGRGWLARARAAIDAVRALRR